MENVERIDQAQQRAARQARLDGWLNILSGLGTTAYDQRTATRAVYEPLGEVEAEQIYAADDVATTIVNALPEDALREWITYGCNEKLIPEIEAAVDALRVADKFQLAASWARLYGGAALLPLVDDGRKLDKPLQLERVRSLKGLTVFQRYELIADRESIDVDLASPTYGEPLLYELRRKDERGQAKRIVVHRSRLIPFDGERLPLSLYIRNGYYHDSVLSKTMAAIRNFNGSFDAAASLMQRINQPVHKMAGLAQMVSEERDDVVIRRLQIVEKARSIVRAVVIDAEEEFQNVGVSVAHVPELLGRISQRLVTASRMPHTKLLGESPSGLGATGESEHDDWQAQVSTYQTHYIRPRLDRFWQLLFAAADGPTKGKMPDPWSYEFRPLRVPSEKEEAELRKLRAETHAIYITAGVVDPVEVAQGLVDSGEYTTIDLDARDDPAPEGEAPEPGESDKKEEDA